MDLRTDADAQSADSEAGRNVAMDEAPPIERRLVVRLLKYWRDVGDVDIFPRETDIDPQAIPDMWPHCALLDVTGNADDPEFTYMGAELIMHAGADLTGRPLSAATPGTLINRAFSYVAQVLEKRAPTTFGGEFIDAEGLKVLYRSVILPLSKNGVRITGLLAAANCRKVVRE